MSNLCPITTIITRDGGVVAYDRGRIADAIFKATDSTGKSNRKLAEAAAARVESVLVGTYIADTMPTVEDIQDVVESVLMESRHTRIARNYIIYRHQRAMARASRSVEFEVSDRVPYRKLYDVLRWNMEHGCDTVAALNSTVASGRFPQLVQDSDQRYKEEVAQVAHRIIERGQAVKVVIVAGPSSSGKTTTTIKIAEHLQVKGLKLKAINIDHYFFDLDRHPTDEFGDHDYETPAALDLALINEHLVQLLAGKTVKTPHYSFKTGRRRLDVHPLQLDPGEILLIDSLHGLYDGMTSSLPAACKFKVYIETLGQFRGKDGAFMRWADNRLLRRMIRDRDHRNLKPIETLTHWHYVRRSELTNIIPYIRKADGIVDSALPYELPILKDTLFRYLVAALRRYREDPRRRDAYIRAERVHQLLKPLRRVKDTSCVPADSLLREFIGGSRYSY